MANRTTFAKLLAAVQSNDVRLVQQFMSKDVTLLAEADEHGLCPIHWACLRGDRALVESLINAGDDPNRPCCDHDNRPIHCAAQEGNMDVVALLLDHGVSIEQRGGDGNTPLHTAAREGHEQLVEYLLEQGAEVAARCEDDSTPLHVAAMACREPVIEILLSAGADPNARNSHAATPLHYAAHQGCPHAVESLVNAGADLDAEAEGGMTPFTAARRGGRTDILEFLMSAHARLGSQGATESPRNRRYVVKQDGDHYCVVREGHIVTTPRGNPLRTTIKALAEEIAEDLERQGPDPGAGISMYLCLCSCLDFAPIVGKTGLIENALPAFLEDPVLNISADPEIMFVQLSAYSQPYFEEHALRKKSADELVEWARHEMASWSIEEVMVVQLAGAHFGSPLMGMAIAQDKVVLETAALGFCGQFWDNKLQQLGGICISGMTSYYPSRGDRDFCDAVCLSGFNDDRDPESQASNQEFRKKCGMVIVLDVLRRFAIYGRRDRAKEI